MNIAACDAFCTKAECEELKSLIEQLTIVVENNTTRINLIENDLDILTTVVNQLVEEVNQLKIVVEDNTTRINVLEIELDLLSEQVNQLTITVEDNTSRISVLEIELDLLVEEFNNHLSLEIPQAHDYQPFVDFNIFDLGGGNYLFKVIVDGDTGEDNLLLMADCDLTDVINELNNINNTVNTINNTTNNIDNVTTNIDNTTTNLVNTTNNITEVDNTEVLNKLDNIYNQITIDISGTTESNFACEENSETGLAVPTNELISYSGLGVAGIHEALKLTNNNLTTIFNDLCQLQNAEPTDVVSIVASPKYITNVDDNVLILHFVSLDNYPKRQANSTYNPIQIPAPKESYDWDTDFKDLRWHRGNQYAELKLQGYKHGVSGWFENETRANEFFDAIILNITTATETNRIIPQHSNPKTNIAIKETRPYRAFITGVDSSGNGAIVNKYFPT